MALEYKGINTNLRGLQRFPAAGAGKLVNMVRCVWDSYDPSLPGRPIDKMVPVRELIKFADPYIKDLNAEGVMFLGVVSRQLWGDGLGTPWSTHPSMNWDQYGQGLAERLYELAMYYKNRNVGWQIENEVDVDLPPGQTSSVYMAEKNYAVVLKHCLAALDAANSPGLRLPAGLATGPAAQATYWQKVVKAYGSVPKVDGFASHLYTQYIDRRPGITTQWTGRMRDAYAELKKGTQLPIYLTELGVAADVPFQNAEESAIALYTTKTYEEAERLGAKAWVMWAWSDWERYGGIVRKDGSVKRHIYDAFAALPVPKQDRPPVVGTPQKIRVKDGVQAIVRTGRNKICGRFTDMADSHSMIEPQDCEDGWKCKIGNEDEWLKIKWTENRSGYIRGDLLEWV